MMPTGGAMRWFILLSLAACSKGTIAVDGDGDRYNADEDCDDSDATSHPGGTEVCDGADNDCDGVVDNGVGRLFYADSDGDGYGNPAAATPSCEGGVPGSVANADDCDDTNAAVSPVGTEVCDGIDNDCDGKPDWGRRVPADYASIGDAIGAASDGDHVCVSAGHYLENVDFDGRQVEVEGLDGPEATIIDGAGSGPVVSFDTKEGAGTILSGFTITGGDEPDGAGIYLRGASPTLRNLIITGNRCTSDAATCMGTGIYAENSNFTLTDSVVSENLQSCMNPYYPTNYGAGLFLDSRSKPRLHGVRIENNRAEVGDGFYYGVNAGVGMYLSASGATLDGVSITGNRGVGPKSVTYTYGAGVYAYAANGTFDRVVIADNVAEGYSAVGGGIYFYYYGSLSIANTAIIGNRVGTKDSSYAEGGGIYSYYGTPDLENVDIVGNGALGQVARGGGMYLSYYGTLTMVNGSVTGNSVSGSDESLAGGVMVDPTYPYSTIDIRYSNFFDNGDEPFDNFTDPVGQNGDISVEPGYSSTSGDATSWDLTLKAGSAMIDAGDPDITDRDGSRSDIGSMGGPGGP
jgi:hypothetical protein